MKTKFILRSCFLCYLVFSASLIFGQADVAEDNKAFSLNVQISEADKIKIFDDLWQTVNRLYFDPTFNGQDWAKLREIYLPKVIAAKDKIELRQVLSKMLGELKTSHLRVDHEIRMSGKTLKNLFGDNINYKQNDIIFDYGYSTAKFGKLDVVTNVDSPAAAQAGLKPGWVIKSCDTQPLTKKVGDSLFFTETSACVFLDESNRERALTLSPSWYLKPRAATQRVSKVLDGNVLYLKFNSFSDKEVGKWIKNEVDKNLSAKAVIVDLRGNHGGLITELKETLSPFFPAQSVSGKFIERDSDEKTFKFGSDNYYKGKVIVLINGESTSAAEIFASIVQESGRGQIVGQKSGGKVLNGITKGLSNDLKLYVAIRDYKTAKGFRLEDRGVTPDVEIPFSIEHFQKQTDVALAKALEILKN